MGTYPNYDRTRGRGYSPDGKVFYNNGWIDDDTQEPFDTLIEKICEPAPWDYAIDDPRWK